MCTTVQALTKGVTQKTQNTKDTRVRLGKTDEDAKVRVEKTQKLTLLKLAQNNAK